jgi:hypothetical protein
MPNCLLAKLRPGNEKIFLTSRPTIGPPEAEFYLWMDFKNAHKIIKDKVVFLFEFYISNKLDE